MRIEILCERVEHIDADALLIPVDGPVKVLLGGGALAGIKGAMLEERLKRPEPDETMQEVHRELTEEREEFEQQVPVRIPRGSARVVDGIARWERLVLADCLHHNQGTEIFAPEAHAAGVRRGVQAAVAAAEEAGLQSLLMTPIGTATRISVEASIAAIAQGLADRRNARITIRWTFIDSHRSTAAAADVARAACLALGLEVADGPLTTP